MKARDSERWRREQIAKAVWFSVVTFCGPPEIYKMHRADSLEEARALRDKLLPIERQHNYGRRPVIYAVVKPCDITVFVE